MVGIGLSKLSQVITLYEQQIQRKTNTGEIIADESIFNDPKPI